MLLLVLGRCGAHKHGLAHALLELIELEGAVIQGRRQTETVIDQIFFARAVATIHPTYLPDRHVRFVNKDQRVVRQVINQGRGRFTGLAAREMAGIVFDPFAETDFAQHLDIELGPLLDALRLDQFGLRQKGCLLHIEFIFDAFDGAHHGGSWRHVMARRINGEAR